MKRKATTKCTRSASHAGSWYTDNPKQLNKQLEQQNKEKEEYKKQIEEQNIQIRELIKKTGVNIGNQYNNNIS